MRSLILYGADIQLTNSHHLVTRRNSHPPGAKPAQPYYVRAVVYNGDFVEAFEKGVKPMNGETFLNTVPIR